MDITDISKINGKYFCFKKILYKNLLYNGQIIKKGESCPHKYNQNCGTIDTLEQELCIKDSEKCPLHDVGIGSNPDPDSTNYDSDVSSDIYYNKDNYNNENKKIIGKLILNEGQPCYKLNEKLWRKFDSDEAGEEHLKCELEVFDKLNDDRYENKGDITYKKIYEDNLGSGIYNSLFKDVEDKLAKTKVSLYKREFLGIDKACDEEKDINKDNYEKLRKNQKNEGICILIEAIFIFCILIGLIIFIVCKRDSGSNLYDILFIFLIICLVLNLICIICQAVFLGRIIKYDFSYDCSDEITNEVLRLENLNTKKSIKYSAVNLGLDVFYILFNALPFLIVILWEKCSRCELNLCFKKKDKNKYYPKGYKNQNKITIDNFNKEPIREVIVKNEKPNIYEKPSPRINDNNNNGNDINNNVNINNENINPQIDLGVPPAIEPGFTSDAKL